MAVRVITALVEELDSYTPCIRDPRNLKQNENYRRFTKHIEQIVKTSQRHHNQQQHEKVIESLRFAAKNHAGVFRKDNFTPYFLHPLEVALILIDFKIFDFKLMVAAILHDVVEDTEATFNEIKILFGSGVECIVRPITKKDTYVFKNLYYFYTIKSIRNLNTRWRVILLKLADRIHNIMTLDAIESRKDQLRILHETDVEFPKLLKVVLFTLTTLWQRRTIKNKHYLHVPHLLFNRLVYEMEAYR